ncbi:ATP-binding cassette domain-containing protein, partial [Agrobacterium sp.]|uniref:ATP-binding cassette domain-containing protein n=1 Tax=Agrobacterium sp. TaxID=361 RepID=UPI0028A75465
MPSKNDYTTNARATNATPLLDVKNLGLRHRSPRGTHTILSDVSFTLGRGEILGIIGESGAGKSTIGNAVLGLMAPGMQHVSGSILLDGVQIGALDDPNDSVRRQKISAVFQDHTASLDPLMSVGAQLLETVIAHNPDMSARQAQARSLALLAQVGIPDPDQRYQHFPHQFSGGQRQRAVIAMALAGAPDIIIADEPTSALDATVQKHILHLLRSIVDRTGVSVILVTHDMGVVSEITDRVLVMRHGRVVEFDATQDVLDDAQEDYTRELLAAVPRLRLASANSIALNATLVTSTPPNPTLATTIQSSGDVHPSGVTSDTASSETSTGLPADKSGPTKPGLQSGRETSETIVVATEISHGQTDIDASNTESTDPIVVLKGISKSFAPSNVLSFARWGKTTSRRALDDIDLVLPRGEITGIVGESGSGKSTIGRILAGLETASSGTMMLDGQAYDVTRPGHRSGLIGQVQMIFQDPAVSLNPHMRIGETLREAIRFGAGTRS